MVTLDQQLIAKDKIEGKAEGISKILDTITLIQQDLDNAAIMEQTGLNLKTIQTLREKLLY